MIKWEKTKQKYLYKAVVNGKILWKYHCPDPVKIKLEKFEMIDFKTSIRDGL